MDRRTAMRSGLLVGAGITAGAAPDAGAAAAAPAQNDAGNERTARAVRELQDAVQRQTDALFSHWRVARQVQDQQRPYLKANHRYPEFIEVGPRSWEGLLEWHVKEQQPLNVTRTADGRYTMPFQFTTIILRPEFDDNYVGFPYDSERNGR
jgi:hypothetical protein